MDSDAFSATGWVGVGLLGVALAIFLWYLVRGEEPAFGPGLASVFLGMIGSVALVAGIIGMFLDSPTGSELPALRCAKTSGVKVDYITEAQADPDEPLLRVPWDDNETWSFTDLDAIACGAHIGAAR